MTDAMKLTLRLLCLAAACLVIAGITGSAQVRAQTAVPGVAGTAATLRARARAELAARVAPGDPMPAITNVRVVDNWGVVALAVPVQGAAGFAAGQTAMAVHQGDDRWRILWPDDPGYTAAVQSAPDRLLDPLAKAVILSALPPAAGVAHTGAAAGGYRLPWPAGEAGTVTQNYNTHGAGQIDFFFGSGQVLAAKPGVVVYVQDSHTLHGCDAAYSRYNNVVVVRHSLTEYTLYLHIATGSVPDAIKRQLTATGPVEVAAGSLLARQGNVGYTCGADGIHLHLSTGSAYTTYSSPDSLDEDGDGNRDEPVLSAWTPSHQAVDFVEATYDQLASWPFEQPIVSQNQVTPVCPSPTAGVVLYDAPGCGGAAQPLPEETGLVNLPPLGWNDRARALAVTPGWSARVYLHAERLGASRCIAATTVGLDDLRFDGVTATLDRAISSLQVFHSGDCTPAPLHLQVEGTPEGVFSPGTTTPVTFTFTAQGVAQAHLHEWQFAWSSVGGPVGDYTAVPLDVPLVAPGTTTLPLVLTVPGPTAADWAGGNTRLVLNSMFLGKDDQGRPFAVSTQVTRAIDGCGDSGEWNGTTGAASAIALGATVTAALCPAGDVDSYVFTAAPGQRVVATVQAANESGAVYDPQVSVLDANLNALVANDDSGDGRDALVDVTLTDPGMYFLQVTAGNVQDTRPFTYTLVLGTSTVTLPPCSSRPDAAEPDDSALTARVTDVAGAAVHVTIDAVADEDWVAVPTVTGVTYQAVAAAKSQAPSLALSDPSLQKIDTAAGVTQTVLTWTAQAAGTYWLRAVAGALDAVGCRGGYTLAVRAQDAIPPTAALTVNGGAPATTSRTISLTLTASDTGSGFDAWRFGADGSLAGATWQAGPSAAYVLSPGDGMRTVFAQARDLAGNLSPVVTATLLLDTAAPAAQVTLLPGALLDPSQIPLQVDASSDVVRLRVRNQGASWGPWQPFSGPVMLDPAGRSGALTVETEVQDGAGNVSPVSTLSFTYFPPALYLPLLHR